MPRLSVDKQTAMVQRVRKEILAYKADRLADGFTVEDVAAALGFKPTTMYERIKHPEGLTLLEVLRVANTLNVSVPVLIGANVPIKEGAVS